MQKTAKSVTKIEKDIYVLRVPGLVWLLDWVGIIFSSTHTNEPPYRRFKMNSPTWNVGSTLFSWHQDPE